MTYPLSQISNIDCQLLQAFRILRQPSDFLPAVYRDSPTTMLTFTAGQATGELDAYNRPIYQFESQPLKLGKAIPFLEFETSSKDKHKLIDLMELEVQTDKLVLKGTLPELPEMTVTVFWVSSFEDIRMALAKFKEALEKLRNDINALGDRIANFTFKGGYKVPDGKDNHLVAIGQSGLIDSGFEVRLNSEVTATLRGTTQEMLDALPKAVHGTWEIECNSRELSLAQFKHGRLIFKDHGILYLYNITSKIVLQDFTGSVYAMQCSDILIEGLTAIDAITVVQSNVRFTHGRIRKATILRKSVFEHTGGVLQECDHIGVACTYHVAMSEGSAKMKSPTVFSSNIQGTYVGMNGDVFKNGKEISFVTGQHDDPLQPDVLYYVKDDESTPDEGMGTGPYPEVTGGVDIPAGYYDICTEDYRTVNFSQAFMTTSSGPQTVEEITAEQFHSLRALMNWCVGEFGPSIYGASYGKLIRTWCMYEQDSAYRGSGKTLRDFALRLRSQVSSWGGRDIWETSYDDIKQITWMDDAYALKFMQDLYYNIRYPQLFGITLQSDMDVIMAMSGMPTMNETVYLNSPEIPSRNKPVVWSVIKQAELNEFSHYVGYYVLYRPEAYDGYIRKGVNPAVNS